LQQAILKLMKQSFNHSQWAISLLTLSLSVFVSLYSVASNNRTSQAKREGPGDFSLAAANGALRIPCEIEKNHVFIRGRIGHSEPLRIGLEYRRRCITA
jgi:hypothetical protein